MDFFLNIKIKKIVPKIIELHFLTIGANKLI